MVCLVFDIGKTNIRASAVTHDGVILETLSCSNNTLRGGLFPVSDYNGARAFLIGAIAELASRHSLTNFITATHGSYGLLVSSDGSVFPLPDYEAVVPSEINALYSESVDGYLQRGSGVSVGASHLAKQLLWVEQACPDMLAKMDKLLPGPQFWAWFMSGTFSADPTSLAAQSHLWNQRARRLTDLVKARSWSHLVPPLRPSSSVIGAVKPEIARATGVSPDLKIHCGVHDSTANYYRFQSEGRSAFSLVSTGTWIVSLDDRCEVSAADEPYDLTLNADADGRCLASVRAMCGREFAVLRGDLGPSATASDIQRIIAEQIFALPSFVISNGFNPNSGNRGRIEGRSPENSAERHALALLYVALMADLSLDRLRSEHDVILDGVFAAEPLFLRLVAALRPMQKVGASHENYGTAIGAALLIGRAAGARPRTTDFESIAPLQLDGLPAYRAKWRNLCDALNKTEEK